MIAIKTLLIDSYRLLKARVLFWITLGISVFVGFLYLSIGFDDSGMTLFFGVTGFEHEQLRKGSAVAEIFYIGIFTKFIVPIWLTWIAVILGLISTASVFPDFMSTGSIEVALSKPTRRLTVFLTKYVGSLLFMLLQVGLFALLVFFALKWRIGTWNLSVFWVVPLATLVFSYLYAVVVVVGVKTKSTLAGVLAAMAVWFGSFIMNTVEESLYSFAHTEAGSYDVEMQEILKPWYDRALVMYAILPKTKQTMEFGDRLIDVQGEQGFSTESFLDVLFAGSNLGVETQGTDQVVSRNSGWYIIGTSLAFEAVLLALAAWSFCRRDF